MLLMYHCGNELSGINGTSRPGIVHRIDMDTTGSLIICKNDMAHQSLAVQLKKNTLLIEFTKPLYMEISKKKKEL